MARATTAKAQASKISLLEAAKQILLAQGYSGLSTRSVAAAAGTQMSQIQYHFGSKEGMVLALFEHMNGQLLERQKSMFVDQSLLLSQQWDLACDYLDDDLESGYVRVLHELTGAGLANTEIGQIVREGLHGWINILTDLVKKANETFGSLGPFSAEEIAVLVSSAFIGVEVHLLLGLEEQGVPLRRALRRFGDTIRSLEEQSKQRRK